MDTQRLRLKQLASQIETGRSIELASDRQRRMLPVPPKLDRYEIEICYEPAAEVSGDFYDFFFVGEDTLGIVLADVTGHGVEAGIIMGMAKQTVSIYGRQIDEPKEVLSIVNEELHRSLDARTFVSLSYAVLDLPSGSIRFARAGQCKPVLLNPRWQTPDPVVVESKGLALGVDKGPRFRKFIEEIPVQLEPGDMFFQYTDGVVEAMNKEKEQFGEPRLMELLKRYARTSAKDLVDVVMETLRDFTRGCEWEDDITILALKVREPQARTGRPAANPEALGLPGFAEFVPKSPQDKSQQGGGPKAGPTPSSSSPAVPGPPDQTESGPPDWLK